MYNIDPIYIDTLLEIFEVYTDNDRALKFNWKLKHNGKSYLGKLQIL